MSFWSFLTGGSDVAEKAADGIYNGIDKLIYTDEEKAEASQKGFELFLEYQKATLPQNKARRQLALLVTALWTTLVVIQALGVIFSLSFITEMKDLIGTVTPYVGGVWAFYFIKRFIPESK